MQCPSCSSSKVRRAGQRDTRKGPVQKYSCASCGKGFSNDPSPRTQYPLKIILMGVELYNRGYPASMVKKELGRRCHVSPPTRTVYSWIERYREVLPFLKLRKLYDIDPNDIIFTKPFDHQQVFPFRYHALKLNISAKRFPGLKRYLTWVERSLPDRIFLDGPRASRTKLECHLVPERVFDRSTEMCRMALLRSSNPGSAHDSVEHFFLANDDRTVCTELPVFLNLWEAPYLNIRAPLTGHIDIVQMRQDGIWLLDYKPNLNHPEDHRSQMFLYREALHWRTSIPRELMSVAVFNEHGMFILKDPVHLKEGTNDRKTNEIPVTAL